MPNSSILTSPKNLKKTLDKPGLGRQQGKWPWLWLGAIFCLAVGLYAYKISARSLWMDELISVADIKDGRGLPPQNWIRPLYYILLDLWVKVGNFLGIGYSDAWLRTLSALFGLGAIFLTYLLGRRLFGYREGLLGAALLTLSPLAVRHAQEARMYSLSMCLGVGGTLALVYALECLGRPRSRAMNIWALLRFLAILTTPLNAVLLVTDLCLIGLIFRRDRTVLLAFAKRLIVMGLLWVPGVLDTVLRAGDYAESGHVASRSSPGLLDVGRQIGAFAAWPYRGLGKNPRLMSFYKVFTALLPALAAAAFLNKSRPKQIIWLAAWALLPLLQLFIASNLFFSVWVNRYLVFATPYVLLLVAVGLVEIWKRWRRAAVVISLIYLLAVGGGLVHYYTPASHNDAQARDYRELVETINVNEAPGDTIVWAVRSHRASIPLDHYYTGSAPIIYKEGVPPKLNVNREDIDAWLDSVPSVSSRVWFVCWLNKNNAELFKQAVEQRLGLKIHRVFPTFKGNGTLEVFLADKATATP